MLCVLSPSHGWGDGGQKLEAHKDTILPSRPSPRHAYPLPPLSSPPPPLSIPPPGGGNPHLIHEQYEINRKSQAPKAPKKNFSWVY